MYLDILRRYHFTILDTVEKCKAVVLPSKIIVFGFDTETNTKIDMTKKESSTIDIGHDLPFEFAFGYDHEIFIGDLTVSDEVTAAIFKLFDDFRKISMLSVAQNISFDINMLWNKGYFWNTSNECDLMSITRLALESKSEREGGYPLKLKPLATRLLGSEYSELGKEMEEELTKLWHAKLKNLASLLAPYHISRTQIAETLKDVTGTLDEYPLVVQNIWVNWIMDSKVSYMDIPRDHLLQYGGMDVILVLEIAAKLLPIIVDKKQMPILKKEMRLIMPLVRMERTGFAVDKKYLIRCKQAIIFEINGIKTINEKIIGTIISPNQHAEIKKQVLLKFGYDLKSTDKNNLHILINTDKTMPPIVKTYLENVVYLRTLEKFISTYINSMLYRLNTSKDNKVYTQFNPSGAVSGRFTSNFQQFPKEPIRSRLGDFELFHPRKMFVVEGPNFPLLAYIDYSQIELRLQAVYTYKCTGGTGDVNMLRAYIPFHCTLREGKYYLDESPTVEWQPVDVHTQTTHLAFPDCVVGSSEFKHLRSMGKRVNFAIIYGAGLKKLKETLADVDPTIVSQLYYGFNNAFKDIRYYRNWVASEYANFGCVHNLYGRAYYLSESRDVYKLDNYVIQGTAADILKDVIIRVDDYLIKNGMKTKLQGCIHDELCIVVAKDEVDVVIPAIKNIMENVVHLVVPMIAEVETSTTNWGEKHE